MFRIPQLTHTICNLSLKAANIAIGSCYLGFGVMSLLGGVYALLGGDSTIIYKHGYGAIIAGIMLAVMITATSARFLQGVLSRNAGHMLPLLLLVLFLVISCIFQILYSIDPKLYKTSTTVVFLSFLYAASHVYILLIMNSYYTVIKREAVGNPASGQKLPRELHV